VFENVGSDIEAAARMFERADLLGHTEPEHYLWPTCQWSRYDATNPMLKWDTAWRALRDAADLPGLRFHDLRHTVITELAEMGVADHVLESISGHLSRRMLEHYSHIRIDAKRSDQTACPADVRGPRIRRALREGAVTLRCCTCINSGDSAPATLARDLLQDDRDVMPVDPQPSGLASRHDRGAAWKRARSPGARRAALARPRVVVDDTSSREPARCLERASRCRADSPDMSWRGATAG
jgi:hypothetical protein